MIRFHCFECKNHFEAVNFNLARITISCPVCETQLNLAQSLTRVYGKTVGEQVSKIMEALERLCSKSKNTVLAGHIESAYARITQLWEETQ
jgi:ribosomal protein S27E